MRQLQELLPTTHARRLGAVTGPAAGWPAASMLSKRQPRWTSIISAVLLFLMVFIGARVAWQTRLISGVGGAVFGPMNPVATASRGGAISTVEGPPAPVVLTPEVKPTRASTIDVGALLKRARKAFIAQRYTTPPRDNALDRYLHILSVQPNNAKALDGVNRVLSYYADRAARYQ